MPSSADGSKPVSLRLSKRFLLCPRTRTSRCDFAFGGSDSLLVARPCRHLLLPSTPWRSSVLIITPPAVASAIPGRDRKSRRRSCRGGREESDGCTVPMKPRTKPTSNRWRRVWSEGAGPRRMRSCKARSGRRAANGPVGSPVFACAGRTDPPSLLNAPPQNLLS